MPYWVYVKMGDAAEWQPVRMFNYENAAWLYVEKMENQWRAQTGHVPQYKVCYGAKNCNRRTP